MVSGRSLQVCIGMVHCGVIMLLHVRSCMCSSWQALVRTEILRRVLPGQGPNCNPANALWTGPSSCS